MHAELGEHLVDLGERRRRSPGRVPVGRVARREGRRGRRCSRRRRRREIVVGFQTIWTSPASDWSSIRPRPSFVSQSRPEAPDISAEPVWPRSAPDGKRLFVNVTRAVTPSGVGAASASWIAWSSGFGGGVGPPAARGDGDRRAAGRNQRRRRRGRGSRLRVESSAEVAHGDPFAVASPSVVPPNSERSLRAGSSIVKRAPVGVGAAAVTLGRRADDREPEPGAGSRAVPAPEPLEGELASSAADAAALVGDA